MTANYIKTVKNTDEIIADIQRLAMEFPAVAAKALWDEANIIMNISKEQCPVKTGFLRGSGHVNDPQVSEGRVSVTLGYSAEYAIYVHENLEAYHAPPAKPKFLEDPVSMRTSFGYLWQCIHERMLSLLGVA